VFYCVSDIHGCYDEFIDLLNKIGFNSEDTLYVLGDVVDRGKGSIKALKYIMQTKNIHVLMGNHEQMMVEALNERKFMDFLSDDPMELWIYNGGDKTLDEFDKCSKVQQKEILEYVKKLPYLFKLQVNDNNFLLVHAGLRVSNKDIESLSAGEILDKQSPEDMLWIREKFFTNPGLPEHLIIFGHTQIWNIDRNYKPGEGLWRDKKYNDKIGIDGGCAYGGGLYALCLDNMKEYYVGKRGVISKM